MSNLLQVIKTAAIDAVNASNPVSVLVGQVVSANPIKISLNQKLTLEDPFIVIPENMTDYDTKIKIDGEIKDITVYNALKTGDKVVLLRMQGGQKYFVLSKVV